MIATVGFGCGIAITKLSGGRVCILVFNWKPTATLHNKCGNVEGNRAVLNLMVNATISLLNYWESLVDGDIVFPSLW